MLLLLILLTWTIFNLQTRKRNVTQETVGHDKRVRLGEKQMQDLTSPADFSEHGPSTKQGIVPFAENTPDLTPINLDFGDAGVEHVRQV